MNRWTTLVSAYNEQFDAQEYIRRNRVFIVSECSIILIEERVLAR